MTEQPFRTRRSSGMDRREFIGASAGAAALMSLPLPAAAEALATDELCGPERLSDWTIDDMWSGYPRYADSIGFGRRRLEAVAATADVDEPFLA